LKKTTQGGKGKKTSLVFESKKLRREGNGTGKGNRGSKEGGEENVEEEPGPAKGCGP